MVGTIPQIARGQEPVALNVLDNRAVPLHHVCGSKIERQIDVDAIRREKCIAGSGERLWEGRNNRALIRVCETSNWAIDGRRATEGAVVRETIKVELFRIVIEQTKACANGLLTLAAGIEVDAHARREIARVAIYVRTGCARVATESQPRRRGWKHRTLGTGGESGQIKKAAPGVAVCPTGGGFPPHPPPQSPVGLHPLK